MKKMFIVALVAAFALTACGGKKKPDTMKKDTGSAMGSSAGSGDMGGSGSAAPEAPKE